MGLISRTESDRPFSAEDAAWQELRVLLEQRIAEGLAGGVPTMSIDAIVDEELGGG